MKLATCVDKNTFLLYFTVENISIYFNTLAKILCGKLRPTNIAGLHCLKVDGIIQRMFRLKVGVFGRKTNL